MSRSTSFIDTHCHLDMLKLDLNAALDRMQAAKVERCVTISIHEESLKFVDRVTRELPHVFGSAGVHPHEAHSWTETLCNQVRQTAQANAKIRAIGETGLDYHYMYSPRDQQWTTFEAQLQLAVQLNLPVVMHTREAEEDTLSVLKMHPVPKTGVAHSFTGSVDLALELLEMGWYIGFNGIVTFKSAQEVREVLRRTPLERLLLETDSPYLTPVPHRGKPNDPSKIPDIARFVAHELNLELEELTAITTRNAETLFELPPFTPNANPA